MPGPAWRPSSCALAAALATAVLAACGSDQAPVTVAQSGGTGAQSSSAGAYPAQPVTRNTARIDGRDPTADAAQVALATHPRFPGAKPIEAATIVAVEDWQAAIAAAQLAGPPLNLPILLSEPGSVPSPTAQALSVLKPAQGSGPSDAGAYAVGNVSVPSGIDTTKLSGDGPAGEAAALAKLRQGLTGTEPAAAIVVSQDDPGFAMPAAAWAARSGDPVFFTQRDSVPGATLAALRSHPKANVYLLGPPSSVSDKALRQLQQASPGVRRISAGDPVSSAIAFARYSDGAFGWGFSANGQNDPGHGVVIANVGRPGDAGAAASLSASGTWGPLLLVDGASQLPAGLKEFLTAIKPGYSNDPTRALYNRVWLIGDANAISGNLQGQIDDLAELVPIGGGQ